MPCINGYYIRRPFSYQRKSDGKWIHVKPARVRCYIHSPIPIEVQPPPV